MAEPNRKKKFLNLPRYPGGNAAFRAFITANLEYPKEALEAGVEGSVHVGFEIHDDGSVDHARILKGIGHGCDEEALRLVRLLRYEKVKNRGVRVTMSTKTTIIFRLPAAVRISYVASPPKKKDPPAGPSAPPANNGTWEYTITF